MTRSSQQQRLAVAAEALPWFGTPYHPHGQVKGVGVDCARILCAVYADAGVVPPIDPGFYAIDHHLHRSEELYIDWLQRAGARETQTPAMGDVALFRFGRTWSHSGIALSDDLLVLHAYTGRGVICTRLDEDPLAGRPPRWWTLWSD